MRALIALLSFGLLFTAANPADAACNAPKYAKAFHNLVPSKNINQKLFSEALTLEAAYVRCKNGRGPLANQNKLTIVAASHSSWMARRHKLDHKGARGFKSRMRSTGISVKTAAENIAAYSRFAFPKGPFQVKNAAACKFITQSGAPISSHSYASLARMVVAGWMKSPGHRKNLMNRRIKLAGGGIGFDAKAANCGRFYITQNYLG